MLGSSSHGFKVNFCKFTNETRLGMEDLSANSGVNFLAALNGICAGGGYELALACDEIHLVDDGVASVALPETPLLGVLPGTGGLTRVVDKRKVRRDLADVFSTLVEGVRGKRAVEGGFVDAVYPTSQFKESVAQRAQELAASPIARRAARGSRWPADAGDRRRHHHYKYVQGAIDRAKRTCDLTISAPDSPQPATAEIRGRRRSGVGASRIPRARRRAAASAAERAGDRDRAGPRRRRCAGRARRRCRAARQQDHWLVREIIGIIRRTLKRLDLTARASSRSSSPATRLPAPSSSSRWPPTAPTCSITPTSQHHSAVA